MLYLEGDEVEVYFRLLEEDEEGNYVATRSLEDGLCRPRYGISDGWVPAVIEKVYNDRAVCRHVHKYWRDPLGKRLDMREKRNCVQTFLYQDIRSINKKKKPQGRILLVRWPYNVKSDESWGKAGSTVSIQYAKKMSQSLYTYFGTSIEISTCFLESGSDLDALAHLGSELAAQGHLAAMYFLWPTRFQDYSSAGAQGMVPASSLFHCMRSLERAGILTAFPHPAHLYETLVSKIWLTMVDSRDMSLPTTTRISAAAIFRNSQHAAELAVSTLCAIDHKHVNNGVAKLGYSWEATDVCYFDSINRLASVLEQLIAQPGATSDFVFVQRLIPQVIGELRHYCVNGQPVHIAYTAFNAINDQHFFTDFHDSKNRDAACRDWKFTPHSTLDKSQPKEQINNTLLKKAENRALILVHSWLNWLRRMSADPLHFIRIDILVTADASVFTSELTELGASFLSWEQGPDLVFPAVARHIASSCALSSSSSSSSVIDDNALPHNGCHHPQKKTKQNNFTSRHTYLASPGS